MKVSPHGLRLIENREGIRLKAYRDSKGLPTIGVGHLIVPGDGFSINSRITQEQCDALFAQDVAKYENAVNSLNVPLSQNQFDALVSFCLNIGIGGFKGSSVARRLKAKDYNGAGHAMMSWVKPPEITGRRQTEQNQFFTPDPHSAAALPSENNAPSDQSVLDSTLNQSATNPADGQPPTPVSVETTSTTVQDDNGTSTATVTTATASEPVTVKNVAMSLWSKVVAALGALTALGINGGTIIETKISEITLNQVFLAALGVGLFIAVLFYVKSRQAANDAKTHALIAAAADKDKHTVVLEK